MAEKNYWSRMRKSRLSRRSLLTASARAGVGAAGLALVGCGGDDDDDSAQPAATSAAAQAARLEQDQPAAAQPAAAGTAARAVQQEQDQPAAAPRADDGGDQQQAQASPAPSGISRAAQLRAGLHFNAASLDPHTGISVTDAYFFQLFHDYLVMHDADAVQQGNLSLAESWEIPEPAGSKIVFNLRDGVVFHNGDPFTSEDVKLNFERVATHPSSTLKDDFTVVESVGTPDALIAVYDMAEPSSVVMHLLGGRAGAMVHVPTADELGDEYGLRPMGTGPYRFDEWVEFQRVAGKRNDEHWMRGPRPGAASGDAVPYFDEVEFRIIQGEHSILVDTALGSDLDIAFVPDAQFNSQFEESEDWRIVALDGAFVSEILMLNSSKRPFDNINVRLAIIHAVHPEAVNRAVHDGLMIQALGGQWPVGTWVYDEVPSNPQVAYPDIADRRAKAKEYLAISGLTAEDINEMGGISFTTYENQIKKDAGAIYVQQIKEVLGIDVAFTPLELAAYIPAMCENGEYHMAVTGWSRQPEPDRIASLAYTSTGYYNPNGPVDAPSPIHPDLDGLVAEARQTFDIEERKALYARVNDIIVGEGHYYTMLYGVNFTGVRNAIQNAEETLFNGDGKWQTRWLYSNEA